MASNAFAHKTWANVSLYCVVCALQENKTAITISTYKYIHIYIHTGLQSPYDVSIMTHINSTGWMVLNVCSEWCKMWSNASGQCKGIRCCPWARHWQQISTAAAVAMMGRKKWERIGGWDSLARGGNSRCLPWVPFVSLACRPGFTADSYLRVCATPQGCCHPMTETKRLDANQGLLSTSSTCETGVLRRLGPAKRLLFLKHLMKGFYLMRCVTTGQHWLISIWVTQMI